MKLDGPITMLTDVGEAMSTSDMEKVFARSKETQHQSMESISKSMTQSKALEVLEKSALNTPKLKEVTGLLSNRQNLRKALQGHNGFGGLDGARLLLNDMIFEVMVKYDAEIAKCTSYYASQCALMEVARGHIAVMTMILEMSDCDAKFLQYKKLTLLKCKDQCTGKVDVSFNHNGLQDKVKQLQSPAAQALLKDNFADMFDDDDSEGETELLQVEGSEYLDVKQTAANKTKFNNPPVPKTAVPANPCTDPNEGAPPLTNKRGGKCTLKKSPRCYKLQGRFLQIQAEIADARDELLDEISKLQDTCDETKKTLESSINNDGTLLSFSQTKLGTAMEKEASA